MDESYRALPLTKEGTAAHAASSGVSRAEFEEALQSQDLPNEKTATGAQNRQDPKFEYVIELGDLNDWLRRR